MLLTQEKKYSSDLLYLGYLANIINSVLGPYMKGTEIELSEEEISFIEMGKKFLESVLLGCEVIDHPENFFVKRGDFIIGPCSSLNLALEVLIETRSDCPRDYNELKEVFGDYIKVLSYLRDGETLPQNLKDKGLGAVSFFGGIEQKIN